MALVKTNHHNENNNANWEVRQDWITNRNRRKVDRANNKTITARIKRGNAVESRTEVET